MLKRLRATKFKLAMRTHDDRNDSKMAHLNKNLALEKPQAIARLDNVLDSQAIPQTPRPSVKEGERRRSNFPHLTRPMAYRCQGEALPLALHGSGAKDKCRMKVGGRVTALLNKQTPMSDACVAPNGRANPTPRKGKMAWRRYVMQRRNMRSPEMIQESVALSGWASDTGKSRYCLLLETFLESFLPVYILLCRIDLAAIA